jgi:CHAT domain-containing protein
MKVYAAGLIDKSQRAINAKLQKKLVANCRKILHLSRKAVFSQELNSFIVISGEKNSVPDQKVIDAVETGRLYNVFRKYYSTNESRLHRQLKADQELRETSKIVKDFIKEIDSNLVKHFDTQLKKIIKELPASYRKIQIRHAVGFRGEPAIPLFPFRL